MSRWPDKYVIGLTGNIAGGKSLIRKMLEHQGAFGIDADGLTAQAMSPGAPAHQPIIDEFGQWIVGADGKIDREKLGKVVFSDPTALATLEGLVHPFVRQAIDTLIKRATQKVVVVEAIKLLESTFADEYDAIWVVDAPEEVRLQRLMDKRKMGELEARQRIEAQSPQDDKLARANVIIKNDGGFETPWLQVQTEYAKITGAPPPPVPDAAPATPQPAVAQPAATEPISVSLDSLQLVRGKPGDAEDIATFLNMMRPGDEQVGRMDVMMAFGQKAYHMVKADGVLIGLGGWQVENLITTVDEFYLRQGIPAPQVVAMLIEAIEKASADLQSEVALFFVAKDIGGEVVQVISDAGYDAAEPSEIRVPVWREAAEQLQPKDTQLLTKRLREDRVMKPI